MNTSGEAAEQIVRMTLQMGEAALKITGASAKQLAVILYAISREQKKSKGKARMETMLRSGRPLTVFSIKDSDVKTFVKAARKYGVLYCAVRNPVGRKDNMVDLIVKQEDAARINRIVERFQLASVPFPGRTERELLSEPISGRQTRTGRTISKPASAEKSSVRQELKEIRDQRQKKSSQKNQRRPPVQKKSRGGGNRNR
nr:PcfB family protein [uncultured Merdimonas sp.]